ncbi:MAG: hypothetical protein KUG77_13065 [Nannocystaceae bacterium]|nr:hypothetical protein [Nannocystaceae bacterium]
MKGAVLRFLGVAVATSLTACHDTGLPTHPEPVQFSVEPGVFLLSAYVSPGTTHQLLGREITMLASGAVFIAPREGPLKDPWSENVAPEFQRLRGVLNTNHQIAYLSQTEYEPGVVSYLSASPLPRDRHTGFLMRVGEPLTGFALERPPTLEPGTPYVQAIAVAPQTECRSTPLKECREPSSKQPIAILVAGVGGPPGFASVTFDTPDVVSIQFKTTLWTRLVVHVRRAGQETPRLLWASERYDLLREVVPYRSLTEDQHPERSEFLRTVLAQAPEGLTAASQMEAIVTFVDWKAPDISPAVLADWNAWTAFAERLPPEWIRYGDGSAEFSAPEP